jgi:hypothetical protein
MQLVRRPVLPVHRLRDRMRGKLLPGQDCEGKGQEQQHNEAHVYEHRGFLATRMMAVFIIIACAFLENLVRMLEHFGEDRHQPVVQVSQDAQMPVWQGRPGARTENGQQLDGLCELDLHEDKRLCQVVLTHRGHSLRPSCRPRQRRQGQRAAG